MEKNVGLSFSLTIQPTTAGHFEHTNTPKHGTEKAAGLVSINSTLETQTDQY
jgi:hypothetical protein